MRKRHLPADAEEEVVAERERHPQKKLAVDVVVVIAHEECRAGEDDDRDQSADERPHAFALRSPVGRTSRKIMRKSSGTPCAYPEGIGA